MTSMRTGCSAIEKSALACGSPCCNPVSPHTMILSLESRGVSQRRCPPVVRLESKPNGSIKHPRPQHLVEGVAVVDGDQGYGRDQLPGRRLSAAPAGRWVGGSRLCGRPSASSP
eukprot:619884-Rhodomonas_salina.2